MRLLAVSNRAPVTVTRRRGEFVFQPSVGGLATGLTAWMDSLDAAPGEGPVNERLWAGWPGLTVAAEEENDLRARLREEYDVHPVFLDEKQVEDFYFGFCNATLWPLFHYFHSFAQYDENLWQSYRSVNEAFRDSVLGAARESDSIWVHDYHLMLLPRLLREHLPDTRIGFFLHIPFPDFEVFRQMPRRWGTELLEGLLGADLIGFHVHDYTQYFLRCVLKMLGRENDMGEMTLGGRTVRADTFPMGIDYGKFAAAADDPAIRSDVESLRERTPPGGKVILSVERLDYTKGIINGLRAFEALLERSPGWRERCVLAMVVVPSRTRVGEYARMKTEIDTEVGRINGRFGNIDWTPILYQYASLPFERLVALYSLGDVAMVTPKRDGMNLIAKEYLASRTDGTGVLVLSELAGASRELGEAVQVNPNIVEEIASALESALEMPRQEQVRRNTLMRHRLRRYDVKRWAGEFMRALEGVREAQRLREAKYLGLSPRAELVSDYLGAGRRLIALDYDGTLVPIAGTPGAAMPTGRTKGLLARLTADPGNRLAIVSGRDRDTLSGWFGELEIDLVAEHGVWIRERGSSWEKIKPLRNDWKPRVAQILEEYVDRLPGSFAEEKDFSLAWHYRQTDPELGPVRAKELMDELVTLTANLDLQVIQGSKVIEVRNGGVDKGAAVLKIIGEDRYNFIMAMGDDWTDEDLFAALPERAHTIKIGIGSSFARFYLRGQEEAIELLEDLQAISRRNLVA